MNRNGDGFLTKVLAVVTVLALPVALCWGAKWLGLGPFERPELVVTQHQPQAVISTGDDRVLKVGVIWPEDGYCSGQFSVAAVETDTEVRISIVTSRDYQGGGAECAGLGTVDGMAFAHLDLAAPLGTRAPLRGSDGVRLGWYEDQFRRKVVRPAPTMLRA